MNLKNYFPRTKKVEPREANASKNFMPLIMPADKEKIGWVSPVYSKSRAIKLDPDTLAKNRLVAMIPNSPEIDFYKVLRTRILRRTVDQGGHSLMITSALPGEGKTVTAINLALTFAKEYEQTVLLVDGDLRMQRIHELMGYESDKGLLDYLIDDCPVSDLIVWPGIEKLSVISGGRTINESSESLTSPRMRELVADMKSRYPERYIFFDVPPVLAGADAMAFAPLVDWIIFVVHAGQTSMQDVNRALQVLPQEKILGLVLNRQTTQLKAYPYRYG
ncbi:MAG: tyrosine protein kinase [Deltaproteobacteria bacterium HGW-Deltaproteobacteria-12]|jgi:non-specific protein-tyrosine kinase|nr:MAG: tyrosine protein kinase [Deltaproteobacteria bacterium HGW-Deltaproteobacteria-12]